jgi:hypothetical protein
MMAKWLGSYHSKTLGETAVHPARNSGNSAINLTILEWHTGQPATHSRIRGWPGCHLDTYYNTLVWHTAQSTIDSRTLGCLQLTQLSLQNPYITYWALGYSSHNPRTNNSPLRHDHALTHRSPRNLSQHHNRTYSPLWYSSQGHGMAYFLLIYPLPYPKIS